MKNYIKGIGLDRLRMNRIRIKSIDFEIFKKSGGEYSLGDVNKYYFEITNSNTGEILQLNNLYINISSNKERTFNDKKNYILNLSYKRDTKSNEYLCVVEMTAPRLFFNTNEENVNKIEQLKLIPLKLKEECLKAGILIELGGENVTYFEVNYNTHIDGFTNTFRFLEDVFINSNDIVFSARNKEGIKSIMFLNNKKNDTRKIKVYDKTQFLEDSNLEAIYTSTCRIEISTNHTKTIENIFQFRNRNLETLCNIVHSRLTKFFLDSMKREFVKPYYKYKSEIIYYIADEIEKKHKITDLLLKLSMDNLLFDIELLRSAINIYASRNGKGSKYASNMYNRIKKKLNTVNPVQYSLMLDNCKKIEEVLQDWGLSESINN